MKEKRMNDPQFEVVPNDIGSVEQITRAEVDIQISTAKRFPRSITKSAANITALATTDEDTAQSCYYSLPRGGKTILGPSVRLAEIAAGQFGNIRAGARIISIAASGENPSVVVQAVAHDLENNVAVSIEKRGRIFQKKNSDGTRQPVSDDDVNLAANRISAIAFRDAVFKIIPRGLVMPAMEAARKLVAGEAKSSTKKRDGVVARLIQIGATEAQILAFCGVSKVGDITAAHVADLIGIGQAIRASETTIEEAFEVATEPEAKAEEAPKKPFTDEVRVDFPSKKSAPDQLAEELSKAGYGWDDLCVWGKAKNVYDPKNADGFDTMEQADAKRLVRVLPTIIAEMNEMKGGAK